MWAIDLPCSRYAFCGAQSGSFREICESAAVEIAMLRGSSVRVRRSTGV
jgi:hypothetical protein